MNKHPTEKEGRKKIPTNLLFHLFFAIFLIAVTSTAMGADWADIDPVAGSIEPGDTFVYNISITNPTVDDDTVHLSVDGTEETGWEWSLADDSLPVGAGDTVYTYLDVTPSEDVPGNVTFPLSLDLTADTAGHDETHDIDTTTIPTYDYSISLWKSVDYASPGRDAYFYVLINNTGNAAEIFDVHVEAPKTDVTTVEVDVAIGVDGFTERSFPVKARVSNAASEFDKITLAGEIDPRHGDPTNFNLTIFVDPYDIYISSFGIDDLFESEDGLFVGRNDLHMQVIVNTSTNINDEVIGVVNTKIKDSTGWPVLDTDEELYLGDRKPWFNTTLENGKHNVVLSLLVGDALVQEVEFNITVIDPINDIEIRSAEGGKINLNGVEELPATFHLYIDNHGNVPEEVELSLKDGYREGFHFELNDVSYPYLTITVKPKDLKEVLLVYDPIDPKDGTTWTVVQANATSGVTDTMDLRVRVGEVSDDDEPFLSGGEAAAVGILIAGTVLGIAVVGTEVGWLAMLGLVVPLYHRITKKKVLDNYLRGKIHGYIIANPGDHYNAIKDVLGINNGTLSYHLRVLEREELIKSRVDGKYKRFYPYETSIPKKALTAIQKRIVEKIKDYPGTSQRALSKHVEESVQVVNYHLKILEEANVVEIRRKGNRSSVFLTAEYK